MKIFISSLIAGMEPIRAAAREAVLSLGHEPVMAEDFPSQVATPQVACLTGIRQSALVVLIMGERYGAVQASGLSATHEEYEEAKRSRPVIAFVQEAMTPEPPQAAFVSEVQAWDGGKFRGLGFRTPDQLRSLITRAIHNHEMAHQAGPIDADALLKTALAGIPAEDRGYQRYDHVLSVSIAVGPVQAILRPSEIEADDLAQDLLQAALFGPDRVLDVSKGSAPSIKDGALMIAQDLARIVLDPGGNLVLSLPLQRPAGSFGGVIQEDVASVLRAALRYAVRVWDRIDATERLTHAALAVAISNGEQMIWRTREEQSRSNNSVSYGHQKQASGPIHLVPAVRPRAAYRFESDALVKDLVTLMRRAYKSNTN